MSSDKPPEYRKRLSVELTQSLCFLGREESANWQPGTEMDLTGLMADDPYGQEQMFLGSSAGPPSIHSSSSRPNPYHTYDPSGMDTLHGTYGHVEAAGMDMDFDHTMEPSLPQQSAQQPQPVQPQAAQQMAWYDTDL